MSEPDTIIIGAGLSGLATALLLHDAGHTPLVLEATGRAGGRIDSVRGEDGAWRGDLGPSWVWPPHQPVVARWLDRLGVATFPQHVDGNAVLDLGGAPRHQPMPGQHGIARLVGGPQALVDALMAKLPADTVHVDTPVRTVANDGAQLLINGTLRASRLIVATPPRIAAQHIAWNGLLGDDVLAAMADTPTWMAQQAKMVATYPTAFWRNAGLSGQTMSRVGPMAEIHDHCGLGGAPAALFGFIAVPRGEGVRQACIDQLVRCFGPQAAQFDALHIRDWASVDTIAAGRDLTEPPAHPVVRPDTLRALHADGRIAFAGAEVAATSPGLIEGAFVAAEHAALSITGHRR